MIVLATTSRVDRGPGRPPVCAPGVRRQAPARPSERHGWPFLSQGTVPVPDPHPAAVPALSPPSFARVCPPCPSNPSL